jgi:hypothetical protein
MVVADKHAMPSFRGSSVPLIASVSILLATPAIASSAAPDIHASRLDAGEAHASSSAPRFHFGFRLAKRASGLSTGNHGSFTTSAQPDSIGTLEIISVSAPDELLHFRRSGRQLTVVVSFKLRNSRAPNQDKGWYDPRSHDLILRFVLKHSNDPNCPAGGEGSFAIVPGTSLFSLQLCEQEEGFAIPKQATYRIAPA